MIGCANKLDEHIVEVHPPQRHRAHRSDLKYRAHRARSVIADGEIEVDRSVFMGARSTGDAAAQHFLSKFVGISPWFAHQPAIVVLGAQLGERCVENFVALVNQHHFVAQGFGGVHLMGREDDRCASSLLAANEVGHQPPVDRVEPRERLVKNQKIRRVDDRREQLDLLLLALRKFFATTLGDAGQRESLKPVFDAAGEAGRMHALQLRHVADEFADLHLAIEAAFFRQIADAILHPQRAAAEHLDRSRVG